MNRAWESYRESEVFRARIAALYGEGDAILEAQKARYGRLVQRWEERFGPTEGPLFFFSAPGRTEIGGNHTDHNNGCVLAAAVNLDTVACVSPVKEALIEVDSEGFPPMRVSLDDLAVREQEYGTTLSLIRGTAAILRSLGKEIGGFRAVMTSSVLRGSGLSSSAAFEVLLAGILDGLYNGFLMDAELRAQVAQRVENEYFGKPCGLMDQMASSVGGMVAIDFGGKEPKVKALSCDFYAQGYALCVINTGGDHGDLTEDYAAIRREMEAVAGAFGKGVLRDVPQEAFEAEVGRVRREAGDRAVLRAMHFYDDNARVLRQAAAVQAGDMAAFFAEVNASGDSSWELLQNVYARPQEEQMALAIEVTRRFLAGEGAQRVHGGGFAGTIQAYVPLARLEVYRQRMETIFGAGCCTALSVRPEGAVMMPIQA